MNHPLLLPFALASFFDARPSGRWRSTWALGFALLAGIAAVAGCGGGVGTGGTGASASFVAGPVTGLGSVIVKGVRFDVRCDCIEDADGGRRSRDELRLGMTLEIDSDAITADAAGALQATATRVRIVSALLGAASAIDVAGSRLNVLGEPVRVTASTVFDDSLAGGLAALANGNVVEVHGFFDPAFDARGGYVATRIERRSAGTSPYRIRGPVSELDAAAQQLRIGAQLFDLSALGGSAAAGLANGQFVRLAVDPATSPARWRVSALGSGARVLDDRDRAEVEGVVSALASATRFTVNGVVVDASALPPTAGLAVGARVEVEGRSRAGVLVASSIRVKSDDAVRTEGFELHGMIDSVAASAGTFVVRGLTVFYAGNPAPRFDKGVAADLAAGRQVEVRGTLSADRSRIVATRIVFEDR